MKHDCIHTYNHIDIHVSYVHALLILSLDVYTHNYIYRNITNDMLYVVDRLRLVVLQLLSYGDQNAWHCKASL